MNSSKPHPVAPVALRLAKHEESRVVRMLLPDLVMAGRRILAVVAESDGLVVGAGGIALERPEAEVPQSSLVDLHVIADHRRVGIGRSLLQQLIVEGKHLKLMRLETVGWISEASGSIEILSRLGFVEVKKRFEYEASFADAVNALQPLIDSLRAHGRIPTEARIMTLAQAVTDDVAKLHVKCFGGSIDEARDVVAGGGRFGCDREMSFVLLLADRVVGYVLTRTAWPEKICEFDYTAIDPEFRRGWASPLVRLHGTLQYMKAGVSRYRYRAFDEHIDSQNAMRRMGAALTGISVRMGIELQS